MSTPDSAYQTLPILPPELEEIIFILCVQDDPTQGKNLTLVSKRVHDWVMPHLYEVVVFHYNSEKYGLGRPKHNLESLKLHGQHVRHILFWDISYSQKIDFPEPAAALSHCPSVIDLALWNPDIFYSKTLIDQLVGLRLIHISFDVDLFHSALQKESISNGTQVTFPYVTHLELIGLSFSLSLYEVKRYFPLVTHLAMDKDKGVAVEDVLQCWGDQLEVLIWFIEVLQVNSESESNNPYHGSDPRVVALIDSRDYVGDWVDSAKNGPANRWRAAEETVESNRKKN